MTVDVPEPEVVDPPPRTSRTPWGWWLAGLAAVAALIALLIVLILDDTDAEGGGALRRGGAGVELAGPGGAASDVATAHGF